MVIVLAPETQRLAAELKEWSVSTVRPFAREADRLHDVPELAWKAMASCPIPGTPVGGRIDYPRRGAPDFDPAQTDGLHVLGSALVESLVYGDIMAMILAVAGENLGERVVRLMGTEAQITEYVERDEVGVMGFAMTEPHAGSDPAAMRTTATPLDGGWQLSGRKVFCSNGAIADLLLVFATVDPSQGTKGIRAFMVPRSAPGVTIVTRNERKCGLRSMMTTEFALESVRVPSDAMLGDGSPEASAGFRRGLQALGTTRGYMAAVAIGVAQAALDQGSEHLSTGSTARTASRQQAIEDDFGRMSVALDECRILVRRFARLFDLGLPYQRAASVAKAHSCPVAERVVLRVLQHLGSDAYSEELLIEKWHRDIKIIDIWEGTQNIQRVILGRELRSARG